ncbi:MAG: exodeoxyribonuclease VII large subunit [Phycisphaerales bacterium]|nr:exodeoxyribonuclease VII large subunit [Phycisphaerales bacterium]
MDSDLFDPGSARGGEPPAGPARRERARYGSAAEVRELSVDQACELIKRALEDRIPAPIRVRGEVSGLRMPGHWYFTLKDEGAVLSCVAWRTSAARFEFVPEEGEEIVATGTVGHYAPQGRTQLYVSAVRRIGAGGLAARFQAMCNELRQLGYFDEGRKAPLPSVPRRIAVITSVHGAAMHDVVDTARRRWPAVDLLVVDARVQGDGAAEEIARAIRLVDLHRRALGVDAILVTRGGGSAEDLWAFNERVVADVFWDPGLRRRRLHLPVVAAIGHESDTTVIELVADRRAATPTQAAVLLVPSRTDLHRQVDHLADRLRSALRRRIEQSRAKLDLLARHDAVRRPGRNVERQGERLAHALRALARAVHGALAAKRLRMAGVAARLERAGPIAASARARERLTGLAAQLGRGAATALARRREHLFGLERHLHAVDPEAVLRRGYSITLAPDGRVLRSARAVAAGDRLVTRVPDGAVASIVEDSTAASPPPATRPMRAAGRPQAKRSRERADREPPDSEPPEMELFDRSP